MRQLNPLMRKSKPSEHQINDLCMGLITNLIKRAC